MEKHSAEVNIYLLGGRGIDFDSVVADLEVVEAKLDILRNVYEDGDLYNYERMFAAQQITLSALSEAITDIKTAIEALKTATEGSKARKQDEAPEKEGIGSLHEKGLAETH